MSPQIDVMLIRLLLTLVFIPIAGVVGVCILRWWIDGEITFIPAILCFAGLILGMVVSIASLNFVIAGCVLVVDISMCVFFPYARNALEATEMKAIDAEQLEKAHARLAEKSGNIGSVFVIARAIHSLGLHGHAIRIAEAAVNSLSTEYLDPIKFQSMRDVFRNEEAELKRWQNDNPKPKTFEPIKCKTCGFTNQAGTIACGRCKGPYLLELARGAFARRRAMARLLAGWGTIALVIPLSAWAGLALPNMAWLVIGVGLVATGVILTFLFRPPQLRAGI
jgi:predicted Zn-ribbon and HTH transcriptional regulator